MIRALSVLLGVAAAFAGALLAFDVMRAVGPEDLTGEFGAKGLAHVQHVLLDADGTLDPHPELLMYLVPERTRGYVAADRHGRGLTCPGPT